jgi:O-antigen ligase
MDWIKKKVEVFLLILIGSLFHIHVAASSYGLIILSLFILKDYKRIKLNKILLLSILLFSLILIVAFFHLNIQNKQLFFICLLIYPLFFTVYKISFKSFKYIVFGFILSTLLIDLFCLIISYIIYLKTGDHSSLIQEKLVQSFNFNALHFSFYNNIALLFCIYLYNKCDTIKQRIIILFPILLFTLFIIMLLSRIGYAICFTNLLIFFYSIRKKRMQIFVILLVLFSITSILFNQLYQNYYFHYKLRNYIEYRDKKDFGVKEDRYYIWKSSITLISKNPFLGYGNNSVDSMQILYKALNFQNGLKYKFNAHNQFLQFSLQYGVLFCILYYFIFLYFIKLYYEDKLIIIFSFYVFIYSMCESIYERQSLNNFIHFYFFLLLYSASNRLKTETNTT